jgi:BlaI family transcriptional regulator, penicillinase repressor
LGEIAPSKRELEILKVLWELGSASVSEVYERLCPRGEVHFNTVQTLLRIMEEKGLVKHRAEGRKFIYTPRHSREQVSRRFLHRVFDGSLNQLLLSLLQAGDTSAAELKELERLITKARREKLAREKEKEGQ